MKPTAWLAAVALAVGGLTFYQGAEAPQSEAVNFEGGWDGVFRENQLWSVSTAPPSGGVKDSPDGGGWTNPWNLGTLAGTRTQWMNTNGENNGTKVTGLYSSIGIGPLFKSEGDSGLAMASISPDRKLRVIGPLTGGKLNAGQWTDLTGNVNGEDCQVAALYGAEVNQKNGYLYVTGKTDYALGGENNDGENNFQASIYQVKKQGEPTCLVTSQGKALKPRSGKFLNQQWRDQFGTTNSPTGNWTITSDLAIDTYGNFYLWGRAANNRHVLLSMQPPKKTDGSYDGTKGSIWYYEVVKFFNADAGSNDAVGAGMAFMNGRLYIYLSNNWMQEWDLLSDTVVYRGQVTTGTLDLDLASTQMSPVLQGTVYNDANGDGSISGDVGAPNIEIEIWQETGSNPSVLKRIGSTTTNVSGNYYALLPSHTDDFYLRVKQPQIGGVNAIQTYASAGEFTHSSGTNKVTALCRVGGVNYTERTSSGACPGARGDLVDPSTVTNPTAATGGAAFVSKLEMRSDMAQAIADFAVSAAGSFGDAGPAGADVNSRTRSTAADSGPVHVNTAATKVTLGQANGFYADGVNDSASNAHASDDGVFLRLHNGSLVSVQDQWLSAGKTYTLAAQVGVASGHGSVQDVKVSGWTSANNATNAMIPSSATALSFSAPDAQGQALADLNVPTTPSPAGLSPSTLRVSASTQSGITAPDNTTGQYAPLRGSEAANSRPWVSDGEIEDYRYYVTSGQVRVALISQGGAVSNVGYTVTNVSGTAPSTTSGTLKTEAAGVAWTSPATHVISSASADTKITLSSVPSGQSVVGGSCVDSASGVDPWATNRLAPADRPTVNDKSITIKGGTFGGSWTDLMCTFTIAEPSNASSSEFTLTPADGTAQVGGSVIGTVTVKDQSGALAGVTVRLASDDPLVTLKNSAGAAITSCVTNSVGQCQVHVTSDVVGKYANAVHATIQTTAGGAWVEIGPPSDPGRRSPKTVEFTAGDRPSAAKSEFTINEVGPITAGQSYTLTVTAYDGLGTANSGKGNFSSQATVLFSADPSADGTFAPANQCTTSGTGVCSVTFTSAKAGQTYALHAKVIDRQLIDWADVGGSGAAGKASPQNRAFQAGPPASAQSSLSVDPASLPVGGTATVKVTLRDQHGNAVSGQATALNVTATTGATLSTTWTETPASSGVYVGTVTAATSGTYTVTATPTGAKVEGTVEFLTSTSVSPAKSTLVVSQAGPLQAGQDYTVVATLYDGVGTANGGKGNPVPKTTVEFSVGDDQDFGTKGFSESTCESDEAGACKVTFSSSKPGTFTLHAKVADPGQTGEPLTDVGGSPQTRVVTAGGPSRGNSELEVPLNGIVGQAAPVTLTLKDAFDNPVTGLSKDKVVLYVVPSSNTTLSEPVETPAGSGVYTSTVTSSVVNFYTVNADPWVPADRPLQALIGFVPAALPADGTATLTVTPNPARAGSSLTATLVVTNSNNQPVTGLGGVLTLASDGMGEGAIPARPTEWPTGTYTWNVDAVQAAGEYEAVVTDGGSGHAETDYELTQVASGVNSSIAISNSGTGNQANNTDFYTLTVTLKDLTGQPITDGLVAARDDLPKLSLVGPTNTDYTIWDLSHSGSGVYTAKLKASAAGNYTIAASYDRGLNAVVIGSVAAQFNSSTPSSASSSFTVSTGSQVVGTGQHTVTATFKNDQGQAVAVTAAQLSGSKASPSATVGTFTAVQDKEGVYQAPITATVAGEKTVEVVWSDGTSTVAVQPETTGQDKVAFVAGPAANPLATFDVTTGNRLTNGTAFHEASVVFLDQYGNPRAGEPVRFTLLNDAEDDMATTGARFDNALSGPFQVDVVSDASGRAAARMYSHHPNSPTKSGFPVQASTGEDTSVVKSVVKYAPFSPETANPAFSTFTVTPPNEPVADGQQEFVGEILLKDRNGLAVPGATASLVICRQVDATTCTPTTDVAVTGKDDTPANLVASSPEGKIDVEFTSTKAGTYQVTAKIGEDPIGAAAPYAKTLQFVAGEADAARSSLVWSATPVVANGTATNQVQALVKDAHDNIVADGTQVSFEIPTGVTVGSTPGATTVTASTVSGYATILLTSIKADTYSVAAKIDASPITGNAPALLKFGNGPVSASESVLSITTTGSKVADGTQFHTVQVELKDAKGNPAVSAATVVQFCWNVAGQTAPCQDATSAVVGGQAIATYNITSLKAGELTVTAKVKATGDAVSPTTGVTANFVPGSPDVTEATLTTSQGRVTNNGLATHWAEALITDANDNPTGKVVVTFAVTGSAHFFGVQSTTTTVTTDSFGKARIEVTDLVEETVTITARITQGDVGTASLLFAPGDVDAASSTFTVTPATSVPVSDGTDSNHFIATVTLRDSANAAVAGEAVTMEFTGSGPKLVGGGTTCTTGVNGTCVARVYSSQAAAWQVKATIDGGAAQIGPRQPIMFTAGALDATHSTLTAQSGAATADGVQTRWVEALVRDKFDNPVEGATVTFTFPAATTLTKGMSTVATGADGKARIELRSVTAGAYTVSAQAAKGGASITLQPSVQIAFQAGAASAANSSLTVSTAAGGATKVADGVATHRAEVQVRDAKNNPVGAGTAVTFTMTPPSGTPVVMTETTNAQGVAVAQWATVKAGDHTVTATVGAQSVGSGNGATARFVPGPVDPARSTFTVTSDLVLNNGVNQHAATVIARDANDNVIESVPVQLTISEGLASIPGPVLNTSITGGLPTKALSTDASGSASSAIVSEEEGTFTVAATIGSSNEPLGEKTVDFSPGSPSVVNSYWSVSPASGTVEVSASAPAKSYVVTITVRSGDGLPVGGAAVRLAGDGGALPSNLVIDEQATGSGYWTTGDKTSNHYGQAMLHVRSTVAGQFKITAQVLPNSWPSLTTLDKFTLEFGESAPDQSQSTFTITPSTNKVDGHAKATITIKDAYGNGVAGLNPKIDFIPPLTTDAAPTGTWGADGVYEWDVTTSAAATYTGTATFDDPALGTAVVKTAEVEFEPGDPAAQCTPPKSPQQTGTSIEMDGSQPVRWDDAKDGFHVATVTVVDARCNPVPDATVNWTTDPNLTLVTADTTTTKTNAFGQAFAKVTSKTSGAFNVTAKWGALGTEVSALASFAHGLCTAAKSSFTVDRISAAVGEDVVFTVTMRDGSNDLCPDTATAPTVQVAGDANGVTHAVVGSPERVGATSTYTVTVTDQAAEAVYVTVSTGSVPIPVEAGIATANPQRIDFAAEKTPANPPCVNPAGQQFDGSHIAVDSGDAVTADGAEYHEVTAVVVDQFCNPITSSDIVIAWKTPGLTQLMAETTPDDDGVAKVRVASTVAGSHEVSAEVTWSGGGGPLLLGGSPQLVTFKAGACDVVSDGKSWFDVDKTSAVAGSSDRVEVTMTLRDAQGNACAPASGQALTVTANRTTAVVTKPSGSGGEYTSTVTDTVAETVDLLVSLGTAPMKPKSNGVATANPQEVTFTAGSASATMSTWEVTPERGLPGSVFTGTLTVKDGLGNPVTGLKKADLVLDAGGMTDVSDPTETTPGVYTYTAKETRAGQYTLKVTLNQGTPDETLPDTVTVTEGPIGPTAYSRVTVSPATTGVGQQATVTVHVADDWNNPITNLLGRAFTVKGQDSDPATDIVAGSFVNQGSGNYTFQITSKKATTYTVHATVSSVDLTDHPTVEFTTGGVCVSNCALGDPTRVTRVEMTVNDQLANGLAQDKAMAFAYDVYGNPREKAQVKATPVGLPTLKLSEATCETGKDGTCELTWTSTEAGTFGATVTIDNLQFATSQLGSIRFTNGAADPGRSTLTVSPASPILVGASYTLQAAVLDASGNPVPKEPVAFALVGDNAAAATVGASCTTNSSGVCTVSVTSKTADTYTVAAQITTPDGPRQLTGSPAGLEFSPRGVCVSNCTPDDLTRVTHVAVTKNSSEVGENGENTVTVFAYDVYGNPLADTAVVVTPGDVDVVPNSSNGSTTGADGTLTLGFTSKAAGSHPGNTVTVGGHALTSAQGSPFTLTWATGPVDASKSTLTVTPSGPVTVGSRFTLTGRVTDGSGNPVIGAAVTFLAPAGPTFVDGVSTCSTVGGGICSVDLASTVAGKFEVRARVDGTDVSGSPQDVVFTPGAICDPSAGCAPDPGVPTTKAEVIVNGVQPNKTEWDIVLVSAYDVHGNPVSGAKVTSTKVDDKDDLTIQPDIAATDANGQTTIWYTSETGGMHLADITVGGLVPTGSPVSLAFGAGAGAPAKSSFTVEPTGPLTVGQTEASTYTVTTTVLDAIGDPVKDVIVTVNLDHAGPTWDSKGNTCTSDGNGECSVKVMSTVAGTYGVQPRLAAGTIGTPKSLAWQADAVCGADCGAQPGVDDAHKTRVEVTVDHQTADGDQEDVVTVYGFDAWGNPLKGAAVVPSPKDSGSALVIKTGLVGLDADGKAELRFSSTVAGAFEASVKVADGTPPGSPVTLHFDPGPSSTTHSTVQVASDTMSAGSYVDVTVHVADAKGNPVSGIAGSRFSVKAYEGTASDPATDIVAGPLVSGSNGDYTFQLTSTKAQKYNVHATLDGDLIVHHPTVTFTSAGACYSNCTTDPTRTTRVLMTVNDQLADGLAENAATVYVFDTFGNPVAKAAVTSEAVNSAPLKPQDANCETEDDGTCELKWKSSAAGTYGATVKVEGLEFATSQLSNIVFSNGAADPSKSSLAVTSADPISVGESHTLEATIKDAHGNPVPKETVTFALAGDDKDNAQLSAATCQTTDAGTCSVTLTSNVAGTYEVTAKVATPDGAKDVAGSPATVAFKAEGLCVTGCSPGDPARATRVEVTRDGATVGEYDQVTVFAFDTYGNPVAGVPVQATPVAGVVADPANGTATGTDGKLVLGFTSNVAGRHTGNTVTVDKQTPAGSPFTLAWAFGQADLTLSTLSKSPDGPLAVDEVYQVNAQVTDVLGNPVNGAAVVFGLPAGPTFVSGSTCVTGKEGRCSVKVTSALAGSFDVTGTIGPSALSGSPVTLEFHAAEVCVAGCTPDPGVATTRVEVVKNGVGPDGVQQDVAQVSAYDKHGNPLVGAVVASAKVAAGDDLTVQPDIDPTDDKGTSTIWYTSTTAGNHKATVTVDGVEPPGSPITLGFGAGDGHPARSSFTVSPAGPLTVGGPADSTYTVTATVLDVFDAPVKGAFVSVTLDHPGPAFANEDNTCTTDDQGVCSVKLSSKVAGTYGIQARLTADVIGTPQSRVWQADGPCGPGCTPETGVTDEFRTRVEVKTDHQVADGAAADVVTAFAFDKWGNPVQGASVEPSTADKSLVITTPLEGTDADGRAELKFTSKVAGPHTATATIGGEAAAGSPVTLNFRPGAGCAASDADCPDGSVPSGRRTRLEVTIDGRAADGVAKNLVTAYVFDKFGNPVATAIQSSAPPAVSVQWPIPATSGTTGAATIEYTSKTAGTFNVAVQFWLEDRWETVTFKPPTGTTPQADQTSSPVAITFTAGAVCVPSATSPCSGDPAAQTRVQVTKNDQRADGVATDEATVHVFDAQGNPVPGLTVKAVGLGASAAVLAVGTIPATGADGKTVIPFTTLTAGSHSAKVTFVVGGQEVEIKNPDQDKSSPVTLGFVRTDEVPAPTITSPADGDLVNDATPTFQGEGEPEAVVTIKDGDKVVGTVTVGDDGKWSHTLATPLAEGDHSLTATQQPKVGNASVASPAVKVTIDTVPPTAPFVTKPAAGAGINDNTPTVEGTAEPGSAVTVDAGGNTCTAVAADDGTFSCTLTKALTDGKVTITVTATDRAGNVSASTLVPDVVVDTAKPATPVVDHPKDGEPINSAKPRASGTAEPGSTVTVDAGGGNICTAVAEADGDFSCTLPNALSEGRATITVTTTDPAGNVSAPKVIATTVDTVAPKEPEVASPTADGRWNPVDNPKVVGKAEPGSTVTVTATDGEDYVDTLCTATADSEGTFTCEIEEEKAAAVPATGIDLTVTVTDPAGNVSAPTTVPSVTVDKVPPDKPDVTQPAAGGQWNPVDNPTVEGKAEPGSTVTVTATDGNGYNEVLCTAVATTGGTFTCEIPEDIAKDVPETGVDLTVTVTDPAGNVSAPTTVPSVTVDTVAPDKPEVTQPAAGGHWNPVDNPTVEGEAEPGSTVTVTATDGDGYNEVLCTAVATTESTFTCEIPEDTAKDVPATGIDLTVTVTDPAGNVSHPTTVPGVTVDKVKPATPVVDHPKDGQPINSTKPEVSGTAEPGSTVKVDAGGGNTCTVVANTEGKFSCTLPDALPEGQATITVTSTDPAGNVSAPKVIAPTVDTEAPNEPDVTQPAAGGHWNPVDNPTVEGKGEPGSTVTVTATDGDGYNETLCTVVATTGGTFTCKIPPKVAEALPESGLDLTVTVTDPAGNVSDPTVVPGVTVDTQPPSPPVVTSPVDGGEWNPVDNPTVEGEGEPGSTVTVTVPDGNGDDKVLCTAVADENGKFVCEIPPEVAGALPDSGLDLTVTVTDPAGNVSDPTTVPGVTVDTVAPDKPVVTQPTADGQWNPVDNPTVEGEAEPGSTVTVTATDGDGDDKILCTTVADEHGDFVCEIPTDVAEALPDSGLDLTVTVTDPAGNVSAPTTVPGVTVDTQPPVPPAVTSPVDGGQWNPVDNPKVEGEAEPGSTVTVTDGDDKILCTAVADENGEFVCEIPPEKAATLPDGDVDLVVTVTDPAGNVTKGPDLTVTVDTENPSTPSLDLSDPGEVTGTADPGTTVTVEDGDGKQLCTSTADDDGNFSCVPSAPLRPGDEVTVTVTDPAGNETSVTVRVIEVLAVADPVRRLDEQTANGRYFQPGERVTAVMRSDPIHLGSKNAGLDGSVSFTWTIPETADLGRHTVTLTGAVSGPVQTTFTVAEAHDTTPPAPPTVTGPKPDDRLNTDQPVVSGEGSEPGGTVTVVDEGTGDTLCTTVVADDGTWSCTVSKPLGDGKHDFVVTVTDPSGNKSEPTVVPGVEIDTVVPDPPVVTNPVDGGQWNPVDNPKVEGTAEPGSTVTVEDGEGATLCQGVADANGHFICEIPPDKAADLADGAIDLVVTVTDPAGNETRGPDITVTVDTDNPSTPSLDLSDLDEITGTADPGTTVTVKDGDGQQLCTSTAGADGKFSCVPGAPLRPGDQITVTVTDPAGNETSVTVRVLLVTVSKPSVAAGQAQTATGRYFRPGESVSAAMKPGSLALGRTTADASGDVTFTWSIPKGTAPGTYEAVLTGALSGPGKASFHVKEPIPATGATATLQMLRAAAAASLFGAILIGLSWRRRRDDAINVARRRA